MLFITSLVCLEKNKENNSSCKDCLWLTELARDCLEQENAG